MCGGRGGGEGGASTETGLKRSVIRGFGYLKYCVQIFSFTLMHSSWGCISIPLSPGLLSSTIDYYYGTMEVLSRHMKLHEVKSGSIESCHRLGPKKDSSRPVIIKFTTLRVRTTVWNAKSSLKATKITMTEFLTKPRQEVF